MMARWASLSPSLLPQSTLEPLCPWVSQLLLVGAKAAHMSPDDVGVGVGVGWHPWTEGQADGWTTDARSDVKEEIDSMRQKAPRRRAPPP